MIKTPVDPTTVVFYRKKVVNYGIELFCQRRFWTRSKKGTLIFLNPRSRIITSVFLIFEKWTLVENLRSTLDTQNNNVHMSLINLAAFISFIYFFLIFTPVRAFFTKAIHRRCRNFDKYLPSCLMHSLPWDWETFANRLIWLFVNDLCCVIRVERYDFDRYLRILYNKIEERIL